MRPQLIILAGGKGTRLKEITGPDIPKPMVDIFGKPFLYWLIRHYLTQGFPNFIISTGHKSEVIENYPWPIPLQFIRDGKYISPIDFYWLDTFKSSWIINGDTFIPEALPVTEDPAILSCNDVDAGAQFVENGKIKIYPVKRFYDIGTPEGLKRFKKYFKNHPLRLS